MILVTGATGRQGGTGTHLVRRLREESRGTARPRRRTRRLSRC
ncbi:hypothetical protein [Lentzea sp. NPDC055074]